MHYAIGVAQHVCTDAMLPPPDLWVKTRGAGMWTTRRIGVLGVETGESEGTATRLRVGLRNKYARNTQHL